MGIRQSWIYKLGFGYEPSGCQQHESMVYMCNKRGLMTYQLGD